MAMPISEVPSANVGEVVQSFINNDGITELLVAKQPDGNYKISPMAQAFTAISMAGGPSKAKKPQPKAT
jgi:hypothetical protein